MVKRSRKNQFTKAKGEFNIRKCKNDKNNNSKIFLLKT
jgi:hypothetical protein